MLKRAEHIDVNGNVLRFEKDGHVPTAEARGLESGNFFSSCL